MSTWFMNVPLACSDECRRLSYCRSFSYRYYFGTNTGQENCLLSDLDAKNLNTLNDLIVDSTWDVYNQQCRDGNGGGILPTGDSSTTFLYSRARKK